MIEHKTNELFPFLKLKRTVRCFVGQCIWNKGRSNDKWIWCA